MSYHRESLPVTQAEFQSNRSSTVDLAGLLHLALQALRGSGANVQETQRDYALAGVK